MKRITAMLWVPLNAVQLLFTLLWSVLGISLALLIRGVTGSTTVPLRMASWFWSRGLLIGSMARLEVRGLDRVDLDQPCLFVANHQSMIDICAMFKTLPVPLRFLLKAELGRVPFLGWYTRAMGMVLIQRSDPRGAGQQLDHAIELLKQGQSLCAFPEGTRSKDGRVLPFKNGVFRVAIGAGVPVVPVAIQGSGAVLPSGGFAVRPGRICVHIGHPIETRNLAPNQRQHLARRARIEVEQLQQERSPEPDLGLGQEKA